MTPYWIIIPALNAWHFTEQAIADCLAQTGLPEPPQVLVIDTGSRQEVRRELEAWTEREPRLHAWFHRPGLPSLSATWNLGLRFVWQQGGEVCLVPNNDTRLHRETYLRLLEGLQDCRKPLFVSAVGRREADMDWDSYFAAPLPSVNHTQLGGPDFSCYLITKECHAKYQFDEGHIPAFFEDNAYHREMLLGGDGHRIFSLNLPYLHYGSATINDDPSRLAEWARRIEQSRQHYIRCWGGVVNAERYTRKGDPTSDQDGVGNDVLQARVTAPAEKESLSDA